MCSGSELDYTVAGFETADICVTVTIKKSNMNILELPDEVLIQILGYLNSKDNLKRTLLVCQRFYRLSKDPNVLKDLHLNWSFYIDRNFRRHCRWSCDQSDWISESLMEILSQFYASNFAFP